MKPAAWIVVSVVAFGSIRRSVARGDDASDSLRVPDISMDLNRQPPASDTVAVPAKPARPQFGEARSRWWTVGGGVANSLNSATDLNVRGAYSYFLVKDVEFSAELNGWYFHQNGPDAGGINPAMVFRWHFYNDGDWTIYGDLGVGLLFATDQVPKGGTAFNFTPRIGTGFTRLLDEESGTRLQVGLRWHHVSNTRLQGADDNPAHDGLMLYAGVQFPF